MTSPNTSTTGQTCEENWRLYDAFNYILAHMTKSLINVIALISDSSQSEELKSTILKIWAAYLAYMNVAFKGTNQVIQSHLMQHETQESIGEPVYDSGENILFDRVVEKKPKVTVLRSRYVRPSTDDPPKRRERAKKMDKESTSRRRHLLKEGKLVEEDKASRKVLRDVKYLTLTKLISFLHAGLVLHNALISEADLVRWIREGFIPFLCAHRLLPERMKMEGSDSLVLGSVSKKTLPSSENIRRNTGKTLRELKITEINLPPIHAVAGKIIDDLQLPSDLIEFIKRLEHLVYEDIGWRKITINGAIPHVNAHSAAFVLVALKLHLGLDGGTEFKIAKFADEANRVLRLKPSSAFSQQPSYPAVDSDQKTFFVWTEWVRFIEYRTLLLQKKHVPTAVYHRTACEADPASLEYFLKSNIKYNHYKALGQEWNLSKEIGQLLEKSLPDSTIAFSCENNIPVFKPCLSSKHGIAEQLLEFDPNKYQLLSQTFSRSTFPTNQESIEQMLRKVDPSVVVQVRQQCAVDQREMYKPYYGSWKIDTNESPVTSQLKGKRGPKKSKKELKTHYRKRIKLHRTTVTDVPFGEQQRQDMLLHIPSYEYWTNVALYMDRSSYNDWLIFSSTLPDTFLWALKLVSASIEEHPKIVYSHLCHVESMIFPERATVLHTLSEPRNLKMRCDAAHKTELNKAYPYNTDY